MPNRTTAQIRIPLEDCVKGRLYRFASRNFNLGVFDGDKGFIGIREKFGSRYLSTELHWHADENFGTVWDIHDLGIDLPSEVPLLERMPGSLDQTTGRMVAFDKPVAEGGKGWYFTDTGEPAGEAARPCTIANRALFDWLDVYYTADEKKKAEDALTRECTLCKVPPGTVCTDSDEYQRLNARHNFHWQRGNR